MSDSLVMKVCTLNGKRLKSIISVKLIKMEIFDQQQAELTIVKL